MTEQESKDLAELKAEMEKIRKSTYDYIKEVAKYDRHNLDISGYRNKTNGEAVIMIIEVAEKKITTLTKAYFKKYPDDGIRR